MEFIKKNSLGIAVCIIVAAILNDPPQMVHRSTMMVQKRLQKHL